MTKREWIDYVKEHVGKLDPSRDFHKNTISRAISIAYENFVYNTYRSKPYELDVLGVEYDVSVSYDSNKKRYYSTLPCDVVVINKTGSGVINISTKMGLGYEFVPMYLQEIRMISDLEVDEMTGEIGFALVGDTILYSSLMTSGIASAGVTITVVQQFYEYGLDDNISIPAGQGEQLLQAVLSVLSIKNEEVLLNNNENVKYGNRVGQSGKTQ